MFTLAETTEIKVVEKEYVANQMLKEGWHLIQTYTFCTDYAYPQDLSVGYVLAR